MVNQILDHRYEILERIGGGGMAEVYRAHDMLLDRYVAVKILHAQFSNDEEFVNKFRREAQGAAKLSHPNIVNIYDVGKEGNKHYIIMEYVSGETLKSRIQREGVLPIAESLRIAREIAEALEHAHQNNLVHCDIKPHNILVTEQGRVKVTDFGIARAVTSSTMTYSGTVIGSVHYFSPEQAKGGVISTQSDIYSLGIVLYEMLTGQLPFTGETPVSIALKHLQEEPPAIGSLNSAIPPIIEAIVLKAMEKEPQNRFIAISDMIADIKAEEAALLAESGSSSGNEFATQVLPKLSVENLHRKDRVQLAKPAAGLFRSKKITIGLMSILVLGFMVGAFLSYGKFWSSNEVSVPDVVGKQLTAAKQLLEGENLRVNVAEAYDADVPAGQVVSQYPAAGSVVKEQRLVTVYISKGGEAVSVPDIRGLSRRDAEIKLKNLGLKLGKISEERSEQPFDTIISQNPRPDSQVTKGYEIDVVISQGAKKKKIVLPDLKGSSLSTIESQLKSLNLKLGKVTEVETEKTAPGTVIAQSPAEGEEVLPETTVDLSVAKAGKPVTNKNTMVQFTVPDGAEKQAVRIVITDDNGRRTAYENVHKSGDKITKNISGSGELRIQIYLNGNVVQEKTI